MTARKIVTSALLVVLLGFLVEIIYTRGFGTRLGAKAAALDAPFTTEEAWIVDEIVHDITEMSAYPGKPPAATIQDVRPDGGIYRVTVGDAEPSELDLRNDLWSPAAFAVLARDTFGSTASAGGTVAAPASIYRSLVELTPASLVAADAAVSTRLASDMRDVSAHESAALMLAGFALREAAGRMADTRWAMNRMTAHLAIATALRGRRAAGIDARLAEATLLALTDRQTRAMAILESLETSSRSDAVSAWTRALRMRITDDWRLLPDPANATRLEQREYFRARRATIRLSRGTVLLQRMGVAPEAEWVRIVNNYSVAVNDGWLITEALDLERAEYEDVFKRIHGHPIDKNPMTALNTPASRCVASGAVHVLPWGAWAEFEQRHLSVVISRYDSFLRHSLGAGDQADTQKLVLKRQLGDLWIFPASTLWWTKGPNGLEGDLRYINEVVDQVVSAPHRVTATAWTYLNRGTKYEPVRRGVTPPGVWFFKPAPRSAYEAGTRVRESGHTQSVTDMAAILDGAPYDFLLTSAYLTTKYGEKAPIEEIDRLLGNRMEYDPRAIGWALAVLPDGDRRVALLRTSCQIAAGACTDLGYELARLGRDDEAAKSYEKAFADPTLDSIAVANRSAWLLRYYASHDRVGPALKLAERVANTGAFDGLVGAAHLYERLGRTEDAQDMYQSSAQSYDDFSELLGFYYRAVEVRKKREYEGAWKEARDQVFPNGLTNSPLSDEKPAVGIHVASDSPLARKAGLGAGDIIVAVDGWHVANVPQYRAVRAFPETGPFTLTVWRGHLMNVQIADRAFVPEFHIENYPVQGWIER
jgi:tetratricopeptide (TPR) repeat protein